MVTIFNLNSDKPQTILHIPEEFLAETAKKDVDCVLKPEYQPIVSEVIRHFSNCELKPIAKLPNPAEDFRERAESTFKAYCYLCKILFKSVSEENKSKEYESLIARGKFRKKAVLENIAIQESKNNDLTMFENYKKIFSTFFSYLSNEIKQLSEHSPILSKMNPRLTQEQDFKNLINLAEQYYLWTQGRPIYATLHPKKEEGTFDVLIENPLAPFTNETLKELRIIRELVNVESYPPLEPEEYTLISLFFANNPEIKKSIDLEFTFTHYKNQWLIHKEEILREKLTETDLIEKESSNYFNLFLKGVPKRSGIYPENQFEKKEAEFQRSVTKYVNDLDQQIKTVETLVNSIKTHQAKTDIDPSFFSNLGNIPTWYITIVTTKFKSIEQMLLLDSLKTIPDSKLNQFAVPSRLRSSFMGLGNGTLSGHWVFTQEGTSFQLTKFPQIIRATHPTSKHTRNRNIPQEIARLHPERNLKRIWEVAQNLGCSRVKYITLISPIYGTELITPDRYLYTLLNLVYEELINNGVFSKENLTIVNYSQNMAKAIQYTSAKSVYVLTNIYDAFREGLIHLQKKLANSSSPVDSTIQKAIDNSLKLSRQILQKLANSDTKIDSETKLLWDIDFISLTQNIKDSASFFRNLWFWLKIYNCYLNEIKTGISGFAQATVSATYSGSDRELCLAAMDALITLKLNDILPEEKKTQVASSCFSAKDRTSMFILLLRCFEDYNLKLKVLEKNNLLTTTKINELHKSLESDINAIFCNFMAGRHTEEAVASPNARGSKGIKNLINYLDCKKIEAIKKHLNHPYVIDYLDKMAALNDLDRVKSGKKEVNYDDEVLGLVFIIIKLNLGEKLLGELQPLIDNDEYWATQLRGLKAYVSYMLFSDKIGVNRLPAGIEQIRLYFSVFPNLGLSDKLGYIIAKFIALAKSNPNETRLGKIGLKERTPETQSLYDQPSIPLNFIKEWKSDPDENASQFYGDLGLLVEQWIDFIKKMNRLAMQTSQSKGRNSPTIIELDDRTLETEKPKI